MDRDLKIRVILTALEKVTGPLKAIGNQSKVTSAGLKETQDRLKSLQNTTNDVAAFRQMKTQLRGTESEMKVAQSRVDALAKAFNDAEKPTKKLTAEFENAKKYASALKTQHSEQSIALQGLRDKLIAAGLSTKHLALGESFLRADLAGTTKELEKQKKALADLAQADRRRAANARQLNQTRARASNMAVGGAATFGTGLAMLAPLQTAISAASDYQAIMTSIAQKTGMSRLESTKLGLSLASLAPTVNQLPSDLAAGADILAGFGLTAKAIPQLLLPVGRAATAYQASIEDLSRASFAVVDNLKVPFAQTGRAIDIMAEAGKRGAFEIKDMAQYFPELSASAQGLGQTGAPAVADLAAALQITRKGAGDAATAANNLQNLLTKISNPATTAAFKKMGVDLPSALKKMYAKGKTPIEAISELTNKTLHGDMSKLGDLFQDMQVQQALRPLIANLDLYRKIRSDALNATGTVERDYAERLHDAEQASKAFEVSTQSLQITLGTSLLPKVTALVDKLNIVIIKVSAWADKNPELANNLATIAGSVAILAILMGGLAIGVAGVLGPFALMRFAVLSTIPAIWGFTAALLANPLTWIVLAIAGVIALAAEIYNHWGTISETFKGFGQAMMDGLVNGISGAWTRVKDFVTGIAGKIGSAFKVTLGIHSPSRVFASYGHNLMTGLANGIAGNTGAPLARVNDASRAITAALAIGAASASPAAAANSGAGGTGGRPAAASVVQHVEIKITAAPGQSPNDIAKAVAAELAKASNAAAARERSSLGDYGE